MTKKSTTVVSGRIPEDLKQQMNEMGINVREAIEIALSTKTNPQKEFESRLRKLLSKKEILANELVSIDAEIEQIKEQANINLSNDKLKEKFFLDDTMKAVQNTLDYYYHWSKERGNTIEEFIDLKSDIIDRYTQNIDLSREEFNLLLIEHKEKSEQTTLEFN